MNYRYSTTTPADPDWYWLRDRTGERIVRVVETTDGLAVIDHGSARYDAAPIELYRGCEWARVRKPRLSFWEYLGMPS